MKSEELIEEIFYSIRKSKNILDLEKIITNNIVLQKNKLNTNDYPKINFTIQSEEIDFLLKNGLIDKDYNLIASSISELKDPVLKLLYATSWKNNDLKKIKHIIEGIKDGNNERPHVSNVCNFTPPTATKPSLLTFNEVTTLFHEFGHGLHGMLANTTYPSLSGTSVFWDFVELPSQVMENWCYEPEALAIFAKHYETGEIIPQEYVEKIKESASFLEGMATLRQLSFGLLDMEYHGKNQVIENVKAFEKQAMGDTSLFPDVAENCMSVSFSHIFQGGYSSGYYSYKWAEVLDADAFAYFQENGIFNKEVATKFKDNVLSKGGTDHPMTLYKQFRGQEPKPDALLKRAGLLSQ